MRSACPDQQVTCTAASTKPNHKLLRSSLQALWPSLSQPSPRDLFTRCCVCLAAPAIAGALVSVTLQRRVRVVRLSPDLIASIRPAHSVANFCCWTFLCFCASIGAGAAQGADDRRGAAGLGGGVRALHDAGAAGDHKDLPGRALGRGGPHRAANQCAAAPLPLVSDACRLALRQHSITCQEGKVGYVGHQRRYLNCKCALHELPQSKALRGACTATQRAFYAACKWRAGNDARTSHTWACGCISWHVQGLNNPAC